MLCISCKTTKVEIRYKYYVPELNPPEFPKVGDFEINSGKVSIEENFFRRLLVFKEEYKNMILKYNEKKMKLEDE